MRSLKNYRTEILILILGLLLVNGVFIWNGIRPFDKDSAEYAERFGAFIGGYAGSLFSLAATLLLFATLRNQRQSFERQDFETRYFELLKLHRENTSEIELGNRSGRRVFVTMLTEFLAAHDRVAALARRSDGLLGSEQCIQAAYYSIFFGVGPSSSRMLAAYLSEIGISAETTVLISAELTLAQQRASASTNYLLFDGHQSRLGHYYRHLYQMVRYVDQQPRSILSDEEKYEFVKTIRAQLSTHEQALLLLNSLTPMGHNWWSNGLIESYRIVENIPRDFFAPNIGLEMDKRFKSGYFEWEENQ